MAKNDISRLSPLPTQVDEDSLAKQALRLSALGGSNLLTGALGAIPSGVSFATEALPALGGKLADLLGAAGLADPDLLREQTGGIGALLDIVGKGAEYLTPQTLQRGVNKITGDFLAPKGRVEEIVAETASDIGGFLPFVGGAGLKAGLKIAGKLGLVGNTAKEIATLYGASPEVASGVKLASVIASSLINPSKIKNLSTELFKEAESSISSKSVTPVTGLNKAINDVRKTLDKSTGTNISKAKKFINSAADKFSENEASVEKLWQFKKDLNTEIIDAGVSGRKLRRILEPLEDVVKTNLDSYGKVNPEFGFALKNADTLHAINKGKPFLDKALEKAGLPKDNLFYDALTYGTFGLPGVGQKKAATIAINAIAKSGEAMYKSPAFSKLSLDLAKAAAKGNASELNNVIKRLSTLDKKVNRGFKMKPIKEDGIDSPSSSLSDSGGFKLRPLKN